MSKILMIKCKTKAKIILKNKIIIEYSKLYFINNIN